MPHYETTKARILQWIGIVLVVAVFAGAYWYFQVYGSTLNSPQNDSLTSGLVGLWSFNGDDISGTTAYDRSGSGNNGTLTNGPTVTQGKVGQALSFDGTDDYVNAGDINAIDSATALTACAWVKHDTITSDDAILSKEDVAGVNGFLLFRDDVGVISGRTDIYSFVVSDSVDTDIARVETSSNVSEVGKWAFVCGTYLANSADGLNIYVNGTQRDTAVSTAGIGAISGGTNPFLVGMRSDTTTMPYDGLIDEVRVYDRALSATEIQSLYALGQSDKVNSSVSQPQGTGRLDSGLAGYWKLDENTGTSAADSSTNANTGTLTNGPTWTTGQIGSAVSFDGTNDYVNIGINKMGPRVNGASAITLSAWLKPSAYPATATRARGVSFNTTDPATGGLLGLYDGGKLEIGGRSVSTDAFQSATMTFPALNEWHFATGILDFPNDKIYVYLDGVLRVTQSVTFANTSYTNGTPTTALDAIGSSGSPTEYFSGSIDEPHIYNRALSPDEISELYRLTAPTGVDTGLKGYWSFNGQDISGTTAYDRSGSGNNGTLTNSPTKAPGKLGQALSFNGTTQYVTAGDPSNLDPTSSFSLSTWVKTTQSLSAGNYAAIAGKGFLATTNGYGLLLNGDDSSKPVFQARTGATIVWTSGPSVNDGNWHFLTGVRDHPNNTTHLYVDGQLVGTATGALTSYSSSDSFGIGARHASSTWGHYYSGTTDEVRFYNRALTAAEIQSLYALGQSDKVNSSVSQSQGTGRLDSGLAGYWKLDENTGTSATDSSTNANTGTLTNGPTWTTGQIGSTVTFDGTDDYVSIANNSALQFSGAVPITLSAWVRPTRVTTYGTFLIKGRDTDTTATNYALRQSTTGKKLEFYFNQSGSSSWHVWSSTSDIFTSTDIWYHVAVTYTFGTGGSIIAYVNGIPVAGSWITGTGSATADVDTQRLTIGRWINTAPGEAFAGRIDEARIYNRVLSTDEISQLYRLTTPTGVDTSLKGYWSFNGKDMSGTTAYDRSGAGNIGTLTNGPTKAPGKLGQGLSFDGTDDYVSSSANAFAGMSAITLSAWIKSNGQLTADNDYGVVVGSEGTGTESSIDYYVQIAQISGSKKVEFVYYNGGWKIGGAVINVDDNTWHHLVVTHTDGVSDKVYVDGVSQSISYRLGSVSSLAHPTATTSIGRSNHNGGSGLFSGLIDEARIYNRAFSADEIKALYNASR